MTPEQHAELEEYMILKDKIDNSDDLLVCRIRNLIRQSRTFNEPITAYELEKVLLKHVKETSE